MMDKSTTLPALPEVDDLAQGLGLLVYNSRRRHWFSSTDERETLVGYCALASGCLTRVPEISFKLVADVLTVNGHIPGEDARYVRELREQMRDLHVGNFVLQRGLTIDDLIPFVRLLSRDAEDLQGTENFSAELVALGVSSVAAKTLHYREVGTDEVVLSKQAAAAISNVGGIGGPLVGDADVLTQLQGLGVGARPSGDAMDAATPLAIVADDAPRLAGLIVQASRTRVQEQSDTEMAEAIAACVRRVFAALLRGDAAQTQKGRKLAQRKLRELESQLLGLIDGMKAEEQGKCGQVVRDTVAGLEDELQVEALAAEYAKRLKAMELTEKRLLRYMKARGIEAVQESDLATRLTEEGVDAAHWQALVKQSTPVAPVVVPGGGELAPLLVRLERLADALAKEPEGPPRQAFTGLMGEVHAHVGALVEQTAQKIQKVTDEIHADAKAAATADDVARQQRLGLNMTRRKLIEMLAEIVQELCQPLSVISCSIDMMQSRMLGEVSDTQMEMLKLVTDSTARLRGLVDGLQKIAGVPATMAPDRELLRQVTST
ncbi:MAG: hypothetical protein O3B24_00440 [Verrucomicrobia bacterium]|nr:hypothetical protein [Verrucomicrobiota bacterium]